MGIGMRKIKGGAKRNITSSDVITAEETIFNDGDGFAGFCELQSDSAPSGAATYNNIVEIVFLSHLCILFYHEIEIKK